MSARPLPPLLRHRRALIVAVYLIVVPAGYVAAFLLRYDGHVSGDAARALLATLPLVCAIRLGIYWRAGLFEGYWQHFGLYDVFGVMTAATVSSIVAAPFLFMIGRASGLSVPLSVAVMDWVLAISLIGGVHAVSRWVREGGLPSRTRPPGRRTLIIGAGEAGERVLRQFRHDRKLGIRPIGLVDDDPLKRTLSLHGTRVLGGTEDLAQLVTRHAVELLVLAMPAATPEQLRRVVQRCAASGVEFRVVRPLQEVIDGRNDSTPLRTVQVEDLLGRSPVRLDLDDVAREVAGDAVLITGGAGSIGGELARQCASLGPSRLVLLDHAETPLVYMQLDLARDHPDLEVVAIAGCVTDAALVDRLCAEHAPRFVFHAAAYKHVPMMEENVLAAVRVNVFGTLTVARSAARHGAAVLVLLSTDKAVHPSSVMGATKRIAERLIRELPELHEGVTDFRAVRFGNVLGSDGSVVPLFRRQLAAGGPLTVTDPEVERYFMTVQEAVQLLLQSLALAEGAGRIAMLEMGAPVRIVELAENLIRLSGREPYGDVRIVFTGLRPGEKLQEDLVASTELGTPTRIDKIRVVSAREPESTATIAEEIERLAMASDAGCIDQVLAAVGLLVPECVGPLRSRVEAVPSPVLARPHVGEPPHRALEIVFGRQVAAGANAPVRHTTNGGSRVVAGPIVTAPLSTRTSIDTPASASPAP